MNWDTQLDGRGNQSPKPNVLAVEDDPSGMPCQPLQALRCVNADHERQRLSGSHLGLQTGQHRLKVLRHVSGLALIEPRLNAMDVRNNGGQTSRKPFFDTAAIDFQSVNVNGVLPLRASS